MDRIADALFLGDATGRLIDVNQAACESLGYTRKELLSLSVADIAEDAASKLAEALDGVAQAEPVIVDATLVRKDGTTFPVQLNISAIEFDGEQYLLGVARDMSTIRHAEEKLRTSEERFKILFESAPDSVYLNDLDGKFVDGNVAAEEMTGYRRDELIGKNFLELGLLPAEQIPKAAELLAKGVSGQPTGPDDFTLNRKGGGQVAVEIRTFPVTVEGESRVLGIARDVTERKEAEEALHKAHDELEARVEERTAALSATNERLRAEIGVRQEAEKALRESEERLRRIFEAGFEGLVIHDKGTILDANPAFERMFGYPLSELIGESVRNLAAPESRDLIIDKLGSPLAGPYEAVGLRKDGTRFSTEILGRTWTYQGREVRATSVRDITDWKQAEQALRLESEMTKNMTEAVYLIRASDGVIVHTNPAFEKLFGYDPGELDGRHVSVINAPTDKSPDETAKEVIATLESTGGWNGEVHNIKKDGTTFWCYANVSTFDHDQHGQVWVAYHTDITERRRAERALRESEARYRSLYKDTPAALHSIDREGRFIEVSDHWLELLGYEREEVIGHQSTEFLTEESRRYAETTNLPDFWKTGHARNISYQFQRKNGEIIDVLLNAVALRNEEGEFATSVASLTDVTERNRAEKALRENEEKFRLLAENAVDVIYRYRLSPNPGYEYISPAVTATTGYAPHEFYTDPDLDMKIVHPDDLGTLRQLIDQDLPGPHALRWVHKDGSIVWMELTYVPIYSDDGTRVALEGVARNITGRKKAEATIEHMAYHDPLTDLPNRSLLKDHLELAIAQARRSGHKVAVMFLDVDRFKVINDTLGHPSGDKLLKRIGKQLTRVVREGDTVARVGGDEFILLLPDLTDPDDARVVAERALQRIRRKRSLDGRELVVTASLGISVYPSDGDDAETLLSHADTAMYKAKDNGRSQYEFYDASMGAAVSEQLRLESDLRRALAHDEFVLHYQPQIAIDSGELVGIEALIRWQHPERGLLLPNEFVGVAQDSGLMTRLDERSLRAASAQCVAWQRAHSPSLRLSVNFATNALLDRGLPQRVESTLRSSGLAPASLVVEITEQHAVQDLPSTQRALRELKTLGVQIAVDDFGTGHSSLAYLSQFPIDVVKIDRAFVAGIGRTPEDSAIVVAIVSMARGLGLKVIAEGVETEEQLAFLKALRCDEFQGYLFSKPVPPHELEKLLSMSDRRRSG
ncbi:MAG: PAS domain S-box protein [Chloroflexi bacterium]|nr:PAS domain S-box protein [Chloroflexota bacterium]